MSKTKAPKQASSSPTRRAPNPSSIKVTGHSKSGLTKKN